MSRAREQPEGEGLTVINIVPVRQPTVYTTLPLSESRAGSLAQRAATAAEVLNVKAVAVVKASGGTAVEAAVTDLTPTERGYR